MTYILDKTVVNFLVEPGHPSLKKKKCGLNPITHNTIFYDGRFHPPNNFFCNYSSQSLY